MLISWRSFDDRIGLERINSALSVDVESDGRCREMFDKANIFGPRFFVSLDRYPDFPGRKYSFMRSP